jgi:phospholipase DDHD2
VPALLRSLDLLQYLPAFEAEQVDMAALVFCTDADLQELGLPMGPRKKILAMLPR